MDEIKFEGHKFNIATPPDGELRQVEGCRYKIFGVHVTTLFRDKANELYMAFVITHIPTGWCIGECVSFEEVKCFVGVLNKNPDWNTIKTSKGKALDVPESCRADVQSIRDSRW